MAIIQEFISRVQAVHKTGAATKHSYRASLETLFNALDDGVTAMNEPKRVARCAPDFIILRALRTANRRKTATAPACRTWSTPIALIGISTAMER